MSNNPDEELPDKPSDDFANFDPAAYVAKHNAERHIGVPDPINQEVSRAYSRGSKRRGDKDIEDDIMPRDVPVGLFARILGMLRSGEDIHLVTEVLGEALPIAGRFLPIIGCALIFICVVVCGGGYLLITMLTRH